MIVDALHLCCCMGLVYVGKMSKAERINCKIVSLVHLFMHTTVWKTDANSTMRTPAPAVPCAEGDRVMLLNLSL